MLKPPAFAGDAHGPIELEVFRILDGSESFALCLSPNYDGLFTHWVKGRSQYCAGQGDCLWGHGKSPLVYKGYFAALVYEPRSGLWLPRVHELSEHAETVLRGRYKRGQVWKFWRKEETKRERKEPVEADLVEERDAATVQPAFNILPALRTFYHAPTLTLGCANPMPPKTLVEAVKADPPPGMGSRRPQQEKPSPEALETLRNARAKLGALNGMPK